jgi:uncharacterized protein YjbI with pentapeptide repeats
MAHSRSHHQTLSKTMSLVSKKAGGVVLLIAIALVPMSERGAIAQTISDLDRLRETGICPSCELSGADLSGMDLSGANLRGARLNGANLTNTNLQNADLANAILNGALLGGANFRFADLTNASLQGAVISPAANFTGAILEATVMPSGSFRAVEGRQQESEGSER